MVLMMRRRLGEVRANSAMKETIQRISRIPVDVLPSMIFAPPAIIRRFAMVIRKKKESVKMRVRFMMNIG